MAIFFFRTSFVKASAGKSAVASAAYQSASKLYDERNGKTFSYKSKEEVVFFEVLLPEHAPQEYMDREKLWNAVQEVEKSPRAQYARQIVIAVPVEWDKEETISRMRDFINNTFICNGMCADWALHMKNGNPHVHIMLTTRGFKEDGSWDAKEKKVYALDDEGNKMPEIDPKTGLQKVRVRNRNGRKTEEKIWRRITVQTNSWNSRSKYKEWKQAWADCVNSFMSNDDCVDYRSYEEQGITDKLPQIHLGPEAKALDDKGEYSYRIEEYKEIERINSFFVRIKEWISTIQFYLSDIKQWINKYKEKKHHDSRRSKGEDRYYQRDGKDYRRAADNHRGTEVRARRKKGRGR